MKRNGIITGKSAWKKRLIDDCEWYGTFNGRWHSNEFWADLRSRADTMTDEEARTAVESYELEAKSAIEMWRLGE